MENEPIGPHKLTAIYARVSTARQKEEETIKTQVLAVRDFAKINQLAIVREYIDDGWSGDILARPQLDQLRLDAKQKLWQAVLVYDPDRLARRYSYQELIMDELREAGVELLFVTTPAPKSGEEKILHGVKGLFAEYERVKIGERFRLGKLRKVKEEGNILLSEAPYGLSYVPKQDKKPGYLERHPEEAPTLEKIFSLADEGLTIRKIVRRLQELGIKPRKSKRGVWNTSTLSTLLRNRTYIGEAYYGKSYAVTPDKPLKIEKYRKTQKTSRRIRPKEEWIKVPVPAVIDVGIFDRVQERLRKNYEQSKRNTKNEYLLAGKIWCTCGRRRAGEGPQRGKHLYYRCTDRVYSMPLPPKCRERAVNARVADTSVWIQIAALMSSPALMEKQASRWFNKQQTLAQTSTDDIKSIDKEIRSLKTREDRYARAYGAGLISLEKLREYVAPDRERLSTLVSQRAQPVGSTDAPTMPSVSELKLFAQQAANSLTDLSFEAKQAIVRNVVDKITATQEELVVTGVLPIPNPNHGAFTSNHRNGEDTTILNHVEFKTSHRHSQSTTRHDSAKLLPFAFNIKLPPGRYERIIVSRNEQGRILRSVPPVDPILQ
jgi:site-specific DNA recombinase